MLEAFNTVYHLAFLQQGGTRIDGMRVDHRLYLRTVKKPT